MRVQPNAPSDASSQSSSPTRSKAIVRLTQQATNETGEGHFVELLRHQLDNINSFVELQWEVICGEMKTRLRTGAVAGVEPIERLAGEIVLLDGFVRTNFAGFRKIIKKCDKHHGTALSAWFMPRVDKAPFRQLEFDALLVQLSRLYAQQRRRGTAEGPEKPLSSSRGVWQASLVTMLVPLDEVLLLKADLIRHLNAGAPEDEAAAEGRSRPAKLMGRKASRTNIEISPSFKQKVTQVYFDSVHGEQYAERR
eukprot:CAMPEP_0197926012 /NCGR_PEP_ID=MMETSP1439-20131203/98450_1 /TAXON_ID=66791 /ORGANISM="Gonyaulax spinifera, Strain CCMP409" /LENGTH=251 /DNA_ID=CAMNT_0043548529 /DNA_START=48 /DNA_END=799 /DNA_ORIENTATION=+